MRARHPVAPGTAVEARKEKEEQNAQFVQKFFTRVISIHTRVRQIWAVGTHVNRACANGRDPVREVVGLGVVRTRTGSRIRLTF